MDGALTHEEVSELLGAYAVDAVEPDEAAAVGRHLDECRRCAAELASYHEIAGMLGNAGGDAPPHLWERLSEEIGRTGRPAPGDERVVELLGGRVASTSPTRAQQRARARRRRGGGRRTGGGIAWAAGLASAAAVAVIVVLGFQVQHLDNRVNGMESSAQQLSVMKAAQAALLNPQARDVTLAASSGRHGALAEIAILPSGMSYVVNANMPGLPTERTYQLWGLVAGKLVSLGLLGNDPGDVALQLDPGVAFAEFAISVEPAGGVVQPTTSPLAVSRVVTA